MLVRLCALTALVAGCAEGPDSLPVDQAPSPVAFALDAGPLLSGELLQLDVTGVTPGSTVHVFASQRRGQGPCVRAGTCLDIAGSPRRLGTVTAAADGAASLVVSVPTNLPVGVSWHFQATAHEPQGRYATSDVETRVIGDAGVCYDAEERPHDPALAEWSYHGVDDGPDAWGNLPGYAVCGAGVEQTPVALDTSTAIPGVGALTFLNYDLEIPLDLLNNGHTLQVSWTSAFGPDDPAITDGTTTWYLQQLHVHSTSEHELDGVSYPFEIHFVHKTAGGATAVVGVLVDDGAPNEVLDLLLQNDPGHHMASSCTDLVPLWALLPASNEHFRYDGSLTTPPCSEGLSWFVMADPIEASWDQADIWQEAFEGTTNRPLQDLNARVITLNP